MARADDVEAIKAACEHVMEYKAFFENAGSAIGGGQEGGNAASGDDADSASLEDGE